MSKGIERQDTGTRGPMPIRFPGGKVLALLAVLALVPVWWSVGNAVRPRIQTFYARAYWSSLMRSIGSPGQKPKMGVYRVLVIGPTQAPLLVTQETLDSVAPEAVREQSLLLNAKAFHHWLSQNVYRGPELSIYYFFVGLVFMSALVLFFAGASWDYRRRKRALQGTHRRGSRMVSWRVFNRRQLGPLWLLWYRIFCTDQLNDPRVQEAARRGRRFSATVKCYMASLKTARWARAVRVLRSLGWRWPAAEGPGISFRVSRRGRAVISEELLSYHLNIFGGTGRGKTTLFRELLQQIEDRGETAIVHDPKRELFQEFYNEERGDFVIDPRLEQCPYWALEDEAEDELEATSWATSFFPEDPRTNPFFFEVPRAVIAYLLSRFSAYHEDINPATCATLGYWLAKGPTEILPRLKGTEHYLALNRDGKTVGQMSDQSQGLFSTMGKLAKPLRMMPTTAEDRRRFSVKQWDKNGRKGWIFLSSDPMSQEAILPIHSAIADMTILRTQAEVRDREVPRVWFVLDEVATMKRITQLESGTTKQRASGNPIVLGFHDFAQLDQRYGEKGTRTVTGQAYTNMTVGIGNETEAGHIERTIGHEEIDQMTENRPAHWFGHRARNQSTAVRDTAVVNAAEILGLSRFEGFITQEGRCFKFFIQPRERTFKNTPIERIIKPLVFREEPEAAGERVAEAPAAKPETIVPVNDVPPPPMRRVRPFGRGAVSPAC